MKKYSILSMLVAVLGFTTPASAKQADNIKEKSKKIYISGTTEGYSDYTLNAVFYNQFFQNTNAIFEKMDIPVTNGRFTITIPASAPFCRVSLYIEVGTSLRKPRIIQDFIVSAGDSISIKYDKNGSLDFTGRTKSSLDCQEALSKFPDYKLIAPKTTFNNPYEMLLSYYQARQTVFQQKLLTLEQYKPSIEKKIFDILQYDCQLEFYNTCSKQFYAVAQSPYSRGDKSLVLKWYIDSLKNLGNNLTNNHALVWSMNGTDFLYMKTICNAMVQEGKEDIFQPRPSQNTIYNIIDKSYSGLAKEKLLTQFLINRYNTSDSAFYYIDKSLPVVTTVAYKKLLKALYRKAPGSPAFDFTLTDKEDKPVRLRDFKGKTIVMDFWFRGCGACALLSDTLKDIIDTYKKDTSVVFISVNINRFKKDWLSNLREYAPEGSIDTYTGGQAINHPLLNYYEFTGFPQVILINRESKIVAVSPNKDNTKSLQHELADLLEKETR